MPLDADTRMPNGKRAIVGSLQEFQRNFNIFTESAFVNFGMLYRVEWITHISS